MAGFLAGLSFLLPGSLLPLASIVRPCHPAHAFTLVAPRRSQAGSIASFLKDLMLSSVPYSDLVEADFRRCIEMHFADIGKVVPQLPGPPAEPPATLVAAAAAAAQQQQQ